MDAREEIPRAKTTLKPLKIAMCGAPGVGKSSLVHQYIYQQQGVFTCGEIGGKTENIDGEELVVTVHDTAAPDFKYADAVVLVFDPTDKTTLDFLDQQMDTIRTEARNSKIILVANEKDNNKEPLSNDIAAFQTRHHISQADYRYINAHDTTTTIPVFTHTITTALKAREEQANKGKQASNLGHKPIKPSLFMKIINSPGMAVVGGVLLLASLAAIAAGTCGAGALGLAATVALGFTIGGGIGAALSTPLLGWGLFRWSKSREMAKRLENYHGPSVEAKIEL